MPLNWNTPEPAEAAASRSSLRRRDLGLGGRIGVPDHRDLVRMDAGLGPKARGDAVTGFGGEPFKIGDVDVDRVNRFLAERPGGQQHRGAGVQRHRAVGAVVGPAGRAAERGEQVLCAPHQAHHIGFRGDGGGVDDPQRRLTERNDAVPL